MAIKSANYDLPKGVRGGSDVWDDLPAGDILLPEWLDVETPSGPSLKYWNGSTWVTKPLKRWNGSTWVNTGVLKRWNGSSWVTT